VWFVDERFVPRGGADRNATPVVAAMRAADGFDASRLHIAGSDDLGLEIEAAAADYEQRFVRHASPQGTDGVPSLDLALLGMGPDGHTASLFPGQLPAESNALVVAVEDSPKPPPRRLTLTYRALDAAQRAWLFATGESKAQALTLARSGTATPQESPLGRIRAVREVRVYADSAALGTSN
jgi:6-phosphogluconolactonase